MIRTFLFGLVIVTSAATFSGCGSKDGTTVTEPPEVISENVNADRLREEGMTELPANVDYSNQ